MLLILLLEAHFLAVLLREGDELGRLGDQRVPLHSHLHGHDHQIDGDAIGLIRPLQIGADRSHGLFLHAPGKAEAHRITDMQLLGDGSFLGIGDDGIEGRCLTLELEEGLEVIGGHLADDALDQVLLNLAASLAVREELRYEFPGAGRTKRVLGTGGIALAFLLLDEVGVMEVLRLEIEERDHVLMDTGFERPVAEIIPRYLEVDMDAAVGDGGGESVNYGAVLEAIGCEHDVPAVR